MLKGGDLNPAGRSCSTHRNCPLSSSQRWHESVQLSSEISKVFDYHQKYHHDIAGLSMATPTMPGTGSSTTTPKKRSFSTMIGSATGETSPGLKSRAIWNQEHMNIISVANQRWGRCLGCLRRSKAEKSSRQKRPSSSLSPEAVADLQQKDEVVVDMEIKEKEELVMEEVPEGQLVVAESEHHETNNKGGVEPHHQPSGMCQKFIDMASNPNLVVKITWQMLWRNGLISFENYPDYAFHSKTHTSPLPLVGNVSLPILPKPLSILKTAGEKTETQFP